MSLREVDGSYGMNGNDNWIGSYVRLMVPEVDGENGMNGKDGWIGCYVRLNVPKKMAVIV